MLAHQASGHEKFLARRQNLLVPDGRTGLLLSPAGEGNHAAEEWTPRDNHFTCKMQGTDERLEVLKVATSFSLPRGDKRAQPGQLVIREPGFHSRGVQENTHKF